MVRSHLEFLTSLPWNKSSEHQEIDLEKASRILNEDHYGLNKIKKRILQHLAVLKMKKEKNGVLAKKDSILIQSSIKSHNERRIPKGKSS